MSLEAILSLIIGAIGIIFGPFIYIWKKMEKLEDELNLKVDEKQVRLIITDKLDPISKDIQEVKELVIKLLDLELQRSKNRKD